MTGKMEFSETPRGTPYSISRPFNHSAGVAWVFKQTP